MNSNLNGIVKKEQEFYTEHEAAEALGISLSRLHLLLDENVFNDGSMRPQNIEFTAADLLLLRYWNLSLPTPKVVPFLKSGR